MKPSLTIFTLLCALWLSPASAEEPLGSNLGGLLDYAREHNPELADMRYEAVAAQERAEPAGALPDPVLRTELMDITNQGTTGARLLPSQVGATKYTLMQSVPWYGKRDLQREVAAAGNGSREARNGFTAKNLLKPEDHGINPADLGAALLPGAIQANLPPSSPEKPFAGGQSGGGGASSGY